MITFTTKLDVQELELHRKLCLMKEIVYVDVEIEYEISKFVPGNWFRPDEGGKLEEYDVKVVDDRFNGFQPCIIEWGLPDDVIKNVIWSHHEANKD